MLRAIRTGALVAGTVATASSVASRTASTGPSEGGGGRRSAGSDVEGEADAGRKTDADTKVHEDKRKFTYLDVGVDSQKVRRKDAPPRRKYGKGLLQNARRMLRTTKARKKGDG